MRDYTAASLDRASIRGLIPEAILALSVGVLLASNASQPYKLEFALGGVSLAAACLALGRGVSSMLNLPLTFDMRFLVGLVAIAYGLSAPVVFLGSSILVPAAILLAIAVVVAIFAKPVEAETSINTGDIALVIVAIAGFSLIWSLETTRRYISFESTGLFRVWIDYFVQAGTIAPFGDIRAVGRGDVGMADAGSRFYHFASYALPGLFARLTGISPLQSAIYVWVPLGVFSTAVGIFSLSRKLSGFIGGAIGIFLLAAVPDSAGYGLKQGLLSFHWLLDTAPGSLYALPCACASLALLVIWCREANTRALALSAVLLCAVFLLRAQIFFWFVLPWLITALNAAPFFPRRAKTILTAVLVILAVAALLIYSSREIAERGFFNFTNLYLAALRPGYPSWLVGHLKKSIPMGLLLAYLAMGGVLLLIFVAGAVMARRLNKIETIDIFPFALFVWASVMMLWSPTPFWGDFAEYRHRGFLLIVVVLLCWDAKWITLVLPKVIPERYAALAACAGLAITAFGVSSWKAPRMEWAKSFRSVQVAPSLLEAANWLRTQSHPGDEVMMGRADPTKLYFDDATAITGISGVPSYLAHPALYLMEGGQRKTVAEQRLKMIAQVSAAPDRPTAEALMRSAGVTFYVVAEGDIPAWDIGHSAAAFRSANVAVYQVGKPGSTEGAGNRPKPN